MALLVIVAIVLFHSVQLRPGHDWSDDYAMYLAHAQNLLSGKPYAATGFLPNPWNVPGPPTYPPVYPLMIAPLVALWGTDLQILKIFGVCMLGVALWMCHVLFRPALGAVPALVLCALFGLSPFFVEFRDEIRPDTLFLALFLLTLWLGDRWTGTGHGWNWRAARRGILLGAVAYLAYGTRSLGLVLIPALWLVELARLRRLTPILLIATSMFGVLLVAQTALLHSDASYSGGMTVAPSTLRYNALHYATSLSILWSNFWPAPWGFALRTTLFAATLVLAAVGWAQRLRRGISVLEVVPWLYFAPLVFYRVGTMIQQRYLLPLLPLYLFYAWLGFGTLRKLPYPRLVNGATAVLAGTLITAYLGGHVGVARGTITPGITAPDTEKIFTWLREHTASNAVVLVGRARAFALYTQRRAVSPYGYRTTADFWQLIASHGVTHLVVGRGPLAVEMDYEHPDELAALVAIYPQQLPLVVDNSSFAVYQVAARPDPATAP